MSEYKNFIWAMIVFFLFFSVALVSSVMQHEEVHKEIFKDYGIESEVEYTLFSGIFTGSMAHTSAYFNNSQCPLTCKQAHEYNEIVGYNVSSIILSLFLCILFWLVITTLRRMENEKKLY